MGGSGIRFDRTTTYLAAAKVGDAIRPYVYRFALCGSYRRGLTTCGDADIVAIPSGPSKAVIDAARSVCVGGKSETEGSDQIFGKVLIGETPVDFQLWLTTAEAWGAALYYVTGSRKFNVVMRGIAKKRGFQLNQYGVFKRSGSKPIPGAAFSERAVCRSIGVQWLPPEARTGEWGGWTVSEEYRRSDSYKILMSKSGKSSAATHRKGSPASESKRLVPMSKKMERYWGSK